MTVLAFGAGAATPDAPVVRGTAQNPDVFFQAREASNPFHLAVPGIVQEVMNELAERTGRQYGLADYMGAPDADRVIIVMGSAAGAVEETVEALVAAGERVGILRVRLFQPFPADQILAALPSTVRAIAVLDRTKEPGAVGEPLYLEVVAAITEAMDSDDPPFATAPRVIGGRYGLSSKEMTPSMIKPIFEELGATRPKRHFTVGIYDDVTHLSLPIDTDFRCPRVRRARSRRCSSGSARTAPSAPTGVGQDHRREPTDLFTVVRVSRRRPKKSGSASSLCRTFAFGPEAHPVDPISSRTPTSSRATSSAFLKVECSSTPSTGDIPARMPPHGPDGGRITFRAASSGCSSTRRSTSG